MPALHVLVIEDERAARQVLAEAVGNAGYSVDAAADFAQATAKLARDDVDVALCDIQLPDGDGIELLRQCRATKLDTSFIMLTAFASLDTAVEALRAGAFDYIIKPLRHVEVLHRLSQIEALRGLREENRVLRKAVNGSRPLYCFSSAGMRNVERLAAKVAPTDCTVLITGESGTGKSVFARTIHEQSGRHDAPFLSVNCAAIPDQLLESEFFGHTKGAFTSAHRTRKGLFLEADRGTLFLDEIDEVPLRMQTKLLHAIDDKEVRPVGSEQLRRVDTRIIVASNRNLPQLVAAGRFREDLFFRLSMFQIVMPPLRERPEDIRGLIQFFLHVNDATKRSSPATELDPEAEEILLGYDWPGNVRELQNVIDRALILAEGGRICAADLPSELAKAASPAISAQSAIAADQSLRAHLRRLEVDFILKAIAEAGDDRKLAAQRLGISPSTLYSKLAELEPK